MGKIEKIEKDIEQLDDQSFAVFREWFLAHENARWDRQIEEDSKSGKLDSLVEEAVADHRAGKSTPLWSIPPLPGSGRGITPCRLTFENWLTRVFSFSRAIRRIHRFISRNLERFGPLALACITAQLQLKSMVNCFGSGLVHTPNTTSCVRSLGLTFDVVLA